MYPLITEILRHIIIYKFFAIVASHSFYYFASIAFRFFDRFDKLIHCYHKVIGRVKRYHFLSLRLLKDIKTKYRNFILDKLKKYNKWIAMQ